MQICKDVEEAETWFVGLRTLVESHRLRPRLGDRWAQQSATMSSFDSLSDVSPSTSPFHPKATTYKVRGFASEGLWRGFWQLRDCWRGAL